MGNGLFSDLDFGEGLSLSKKVLLPLIVPNVIPQRTFKAKWVAPTLKELKRRKDVEISKAGGEKIFHRSTFLEWNYDAELYAFGNRLGETFEEPLLRAALTHSSYIRQESEKLSALGMQPDLQFQDNELLASDGKKLISKFINGYLRAVFTRVPEEMIVVMHDFLISDSTLETVAKHIGLGDIVLCADFPCETETYVKSLNAIVAALKESSGEERARLFVQDLIVTQIYGRDVNELWNPKDPIGILTSILKREGKGEPEFRIIRQTATNTILAVYHVGVYSDKNFIAEGGGESVEIAQDMAARDALKRFFHTDDAMKALPFGRQLKSIQSKIAELENQPNLPLSQWSLEKVASTAH
uniref:Large ribosomal subunit protein mL44 n=1 Tax=Scapholeberis mucronata TaxID=202097 RepID=A0A4Y7NKW8_9CRUS|nr:EOG090X0DYO [Scapholeberis mucronata]SVE93891.1 EOG090X0DYO [Scapholeberis mucronata]